MEQLHRKIIILLIFTTLWGCVSINSTNEKDFQVFIENEIEDDINNGNLYIAYQKYNYYREKLNLSDNLNIFEEKLKSQLSELKSDGNWTEFRTTLNNLQKLNSEFSYTSDPIELFSYFEEQEMINRADIILAERELLYSNLESEQLEFLYNQFYEIVNEKDFPRLAQEYSSRGLGSKKHESDLDYLNGLLTVFVNNGVKFINGVGTQDLVVGSGFFIDKLGYAVTNYHVISSIVDPENEGQSDIYIKLNGSLDKIPCSVVGWDPVFDLALLKIPTIPQYYYSLLDEKNSVGESVIALGSPGGLGSTVTSGIVSATDRNLLEMGSVIQIDSAINPGNSGGPLINQKNQVTNIVFAGIETFEGVNFAIPVKYLIHSLGKLYRGGEINHNWLGVGLTERKAALEIIYIKPNSPAYYMGLTKGDIIKTVDGQIYDSISDIQDYLLTCEKNQLISIEYFREGVRDTVLVPLNDRPPVVMEDILKNDTADHLYIPLFGMDLSFSGKLLWDREYQVNDVYPGSVADDLDLNRGDIIEVKKWEYLEEYRVVLLQLILQSRDEGFWKKSIQITAPISVNLFI